MLVGESERGTTIIVKTNITVDMYTASRKTEIQMNYYNEDATNYGIGSEWKMITEPSSYMLIGRQGKDSAELNIVAPEGLVNAQMITGYKDNASIISVNQGRKEDTVGTFKDARQAEMKLIVINNTEDDMKDVSILGRTIFNGNKAITEDVALGTNIDAPMLTKINGNNAIIYYSENGEATRDLQDRKNGWTEDITELKDVKSYLIVLEDDVKVGDILTYTYNFEIPANLLNNVDLAGTFATYYTDSESEKVNEADRVVLTTGDAPIINAEMTNDVKGDVVLEGQYINYTITVRNDGRTSAENVVLKAAIPEGTAYVNEGKIDENVTDLVIEIGEIKAYNTETINFQLVVKEGYEGDISFEGIIEANGLEEGIVLKQEQDFHIDSSKIEIKFKTDRYGSDLLPNMEMKYMLKITNKESDPINDIVVKQIIPEGVDFVDAYVYSNDLNMNKGIYDPDTRIVTLTIDSLEKLKEIIVIVKGQNITEYEKMLVSFATIESENLEAVYNTGEVYTKLARPELKIDSYTNADNRYLKEGDYVEYILNVQNIGGTNAEAINISSNISKYLEISGGMCEIDDGTVINQFPANKYYSQINLSAGESARIKLKCRVVSLNSTSEVFADAFWNISGENIDTVQTPKIENILQPVEKKSIASDTETGAIHIQSDSLNDFTAIASSNSDGPQIYINNDSNNVNVEDVQNTTHRIIGKAFYDLNKNGQRDDNEDGMENIVVKLCDVSSQNIVSQTVTNAAGEYIFDNVAASDYYVKFEYDSSKYQVTDYKKEGVNADRNSDAIVSNYKAVTDKIIITNSSVSDIDVGLYRAGIFDLSLDVNINRLTVQNEAETTTYEMENSKLAKVDIDPKYASNSKIFVEYTIDVSNKGEIAGYAKSIMSYLPEELELDTSLNANWYVDSNRIAHTSELENILIQPGETKTITLLLTKQMTEDSTGLINNVFEIENTFNEYAITDIDSVEGNHADGEDDMSSADVIIGIKTGGSMINVMIITTTLITLIAVLYVLKLRSDNQGKEVLI